MRNFLPFPCLSIRVGRHAIVMLVGTSLCVWWAVHIRAADAPREAVLSTVSESCFDCHGNGQREGGLQLDALLREPAGDAVRAVWWKVIENIRARTMPPPDSGYSLTAEQIDQLAHWIKYDALGIDPDDPDPGSVTLRRLNRREYAATIRDLMGIEFNADIVFPPDDTGFGFDNIGDALSVSPMLVEKYLACAEQIVNESVPRVTTAISKIEFPSNALRTEAGQDASRMSMAQPARIEREFSIEQSGDYQLKILLQADGTFAYCADRCSLRIDLDGSRLHAADYKWEDNKKSTLNYQRSLSAGEHRLICRLTPIEPAETTPTDDDPQTDDAEAAQSWLSIDAVVIEGPSAPLLWKNPPGYERFFTRPTPPEDADARREYAAEVLGRFAFRAFRRPADPGTIERLVSIAEEVFRQDGKSFEDGIAAAMIPVLASPRFLLRFEKTEPGGEPGRHPLIDEFALASRLSYFLWSTMPDEELFELAQQGQLRKQLERQLLRMLSDERSSAFIDSFVGQWLRTNDVEKVSIDALSALGHREEYDLLLDEYRALRDMESLSAAQQVELDELRSKFRNISKYRDMLDGEARTAMRRETEMLVEKVIRENRSLSELIDPGYTFLNERLAELYGIEGVVGKEMRQVELPNDSPRGGLLAQGTLLTVTSNPTRTSPVKRGLYILENILGTPTPPAPPNVPELEASKDRFQGREPSLRELLAAHRESALCASCHARMDPLGLALENFNALGMWRDVDNGQPIDAAGQLVTGEKFTDVRQLRELIAHDRREDFYRCVTEKLFIYALGRGLEYYDQHAIDSIVAELIRDNGKFETLLVGIVRSPAFQRQRLPDQTARQLSSTP